MPRRPGGKHTSRIWSVAFSPQGNTLVSGRKTIRETMGYQDRAMPEDVADTMMLSGALLSVRWSNSSQWR